MPFLVGIGKNIFAFVVVFALALGAFFSDGEHAPKATEEGSAPQKEEAREETLIVPASTPVHEMETPHNRAQLAEPDSSNEVSEELNTESEKQADSLGTTPAASPEEGVFKNINQPVRESVVNILCEMRTGSVTKTITGTGVLIDRRGVVLTNAHIAQYFLLKNYPEPNATTCSIRVGNPAEARYRADVMYIPITWIQAHAHEINEESPSGTGEGDYAFLYITDPIDENDERPKQFPFLTLNASEAVIASKTPVLIVSYPALVAETDSIKNSLFLVSAVAETKTLFTFTENLLDLFAIEGNIAAHRGSSGGAVILENGDLAGLIVTSTGNALVLERELRALTPAYINRSLEKENGTTLGQFLFGDPGLRTKAFGVTTAPLLSNILKQALE